MLEEIIKKVNIVLMGKFPDLKQREDMLIKAGEIILFETGEEVSKLLNNDEKVENLFQLLDKQDMAAAIVFAKENGINMEEILERKSLEVTKMIFSM